MPQKINSNLTCVQMYELSITIKTKTLVNDNENLMLLIDLKLKRDCCRCDDDNTTNMRETWIVGKIYHSLKHLREDFFPLIHHRIATRRWSSEAEEYCKIEDFCNDACRSE